MAGTIALISDMHLAPLEAHAERAQSSIDRPARRARHMDAALGQALATKPDAVFFGGDNTNQPVDQAAYLGAFTTYLETIKTPWFAIPGNHDVGSAVGWHHHDPRRLQACCDAFHRHIGPAHWVCESAGFRVIAVNSQIFGARIPAAAEQNAWLVAKLAEPTTLLKTVFFHTPAYLCTPEDHFSDGSEQMCLTPEAREPLLAALITSPPALVITGHAHRFWTRRGPQWDWLGLPATALGQNEMTAVPSHHLPAGDDRVGWVSLQRVDDSWEATFHSVA